MKPILLLTIFSLLFGSYLCLTHAIHKYHHKFNYKGFPMPESEESVKESVLKVINSHKSAPSADVKAAPSISSIPFSKISPYDRYPLRGIHKWRNIYYSADQKILSPAEINLKKALSDVFTPLTKKIQKWMIALENQKIKLGSKFKYYRESDQLQKLHILLNHIKEKLVYTKGLTVEDMEYNFSEEAKPLFQEFSKIESYMQGIVGTSESPKFTGVTAQWGWFKRLVKRVVNVVKKVVKTVATVAVKVVKTAVKIAGRVINTVVQFQVAMIKGAFNFVKALIRGQFIGTELDAPCAFACSSGLTCFPFVQKCVPSLGSIFLKGASSIVGCIFNSKSVLLGFLKKFAEGLRRVINKPNLKNLCGAIADPIGEVLKCGSGLLGKDFDNLAFGISFGASAIIKGSAGISFGVRKNGDTFCSYSTCEGMALAIGVDIGFSLGLSRGEPEVSTTTEYGAGVSIFGVTYSFDTDNKFDGVSISGSIDLGSKDILPITLERNVCKTRGVLIVPAKIHKLKIKPADSSNNRNYQALSNFIDEESTLGPGQSIYTVVNTNGQTPEFYATMGHDCVFAIFTKEGRAVFATDTKNFQQGRYCYLKLEKNGRLNLYRGKNIVWTSKTGNMWGSEPYKAILLYSGTLAIYKGNRKVWSTVGIDILPKNEILTVGQLLISENKQYFLSLAVDGELFIGHASKGYSDPKNFIWRTKEPSKKKIVNNLYAIMQGDCQLVIYYSGKPYWSTGSFRNNRNCLATISDDGRLIIIDDQNGIVWKSGDIQSSVLNRWKANARH